MKAARLVLALAATSTLALGAVVALPTAQAAPGDTWSGYKVLDVQPKATTQTWIVGVKPHINGPGDLFNMMRMVEDKNGNESWVFCIDLLQPGEPLAFTEDPLKASTAAGRANASKINRVIASSQLPKPGALEVTAPDSSKLDVTRDRVMANKKDVIEAAAIQLALWHYTDGVSPTAANASIADTFYPASYVGDADDVTIGEILTRYNALVAAAEANPLDPSTPKVTITPGTSTTEAGKALTFTVAGEDIDGTIKLTTDDASVKLHPVKADASCDTATDITTLPAAGGKVCAVSETVRTIKITAKGASPENSPHLLYALEAQSVIGIGPDAAQGSADAIWTGPTASETPNNNNATSTPSGTPSESCGSTPSASASASETPNNNNATSTPSATPSATCSTSTPSVSETESTGGADVETDEAGVPNTGGNADAPGGALADTGPQFGLLDRMTLALAALALGTTFVVITRRRAARTH